MPPDLAQVQPVPGSYIIRINDQSTSPPAGYRFAVRNNGIDLLAVKETGMVVVGGTDGTVRRQGGTVEFEAAAGSGAAFQFSVGGTAKLAIPHSGPADVPRVILDVVSVLPSPPPAAGCVLIHKEMVIGVGPVYYLCVSVDNGTQLVWYRKREA